VMTPRPLARIASGGETSRLFLAIKNVLNAGNTQKTFVFDEIDTGISGAAIELVGLKLKDLAKRAQVFCVTHHPQIASQADRHFLVEKSQNNKQVITRIRTLAQTERVDEVARLLGGLKITKKNRAYAEELIKRK
ncbi:MAG: DNA repair protein RecN, partial [Deltaproteobacteria bacterium]|nr:DNA repair protein RecN [Deltaproteobacteria bacterium]